MKLFMRRNILLFLIFVFIAVVLSTVSVKAQGLRAWIRFSNIQSYFTDYGTETESDETPFMDRPMSGLLRMD